MIYSYCCQGNGAPHVTGGIREQHCCIQTISEELCRECDQREWMPSVRISSLCVWCMVWWHKCFSVLVYRVMLVVTVFLSMKCGRILNTCKREYLLWDVMWLGNNYWWLCKWWISLKYCFLIVFSGITHHVHVKHFAKVMWITWLIIRWQRPWSYQVCVCVCVYVCVCMCLCVH